MPIIYRCAGCGYVLCRCDFHTFGYAPPLTPQEVYDTNQGRCPCCQKTLNLSLNAQEVEMRPAEGGESPAAKASSKAGRKRRRRKSGGRPDTSTIEILHALMKRAYSSSPA